MVSRALKPIRCKAAVCWGPEEALTVEEIEVEAPRASEVRVRLLFASLCHTDLYCRGGFPFPLYPRVLGHEGVGEIESVGEGVEGLKEGDTVIPTFIGECGDCANCRSGKTNVCLKHQLTIDGLMPDQTTRMSVRGQRLYHLLSCSTFSQFTVVDANYVVKVDPRLELPHASLLACGFTTGFGAVHYEARVEPGSTVAVFGLGGVGLGAIVGARLAGASKIIGVDTNDRKRGKAEAYGMTEFINPKGTESATVVEAIQAMTDGVGVDYSFECSGAVPAANQAFQATALGRGVTVVVGIASEMDASISRKALLFGRTLKGSTFGGVRPRSDLPSLVAKCIDKEIRLDEMVTHRVHLDDINHAFDLLRDADCLKVVIKINDE